MRKLSIFGIIILSVIISSLQGCTSNSAGGYTFGRAGSLAWHATSPRSEKNSYYDSKSEVALCNIWSANYPGGHPAWDENRQEVGYALKRRGLGSMHCSNPSADETSVARKDARKANAAAARAKKEAAAARREAENAKRDACQIRWDAYNDCRASKAASDYYSCRRPLC